LIRLVFRRIWLIALLVVLAQVATWFVTRNDPEVYEETAAFVIRPSTAIEAKQIPDALRGISAQDGELPQTVARVLESEEFFRQAFREGLGTPVDPRYSLNSSTRPGSHVIEVAIRGPDPASLGLLASAFSTAATTWVSEVYRAYALDVLEVEGSDGPVSPSRAQLMGLATVLGALVGLGLVLLEYQSQERRSSREPPRIQPEPTEEQAIRVATSQNVSEAHDAPETARRRRRRAAVESEPRAGPARRTS
jgi:capsular polysaccharide biosynthesis protein